MSALGDEYVGRLDITMDDALVMSSIKGVANLDPQSEERVHRQGATSYAMLECHPIQVFHGDEGLVLMPPNLVDGANVRMVQSGGGTRLSAKAFERLRVFRHLVR